VAFETSLQNVGNPTLKDNLSLSGDYDEDEDGRYDEESCNNNIETFTDRSSLDVVECVQGSDLLSHPHDEVIDATVKLLRLLANLSIDEGIGKYISSRVEPFQVE